MEKRSYYAISSSELKILKKTYHTPPSSSELTTTSLIHLKQKKIRTILLKLESLPKNYDFMSSHISKATKKIHKWANTKSSTMKSKEERKNLKILSKAQMLPSLTTFTDENFTLMAMQGIEFIRKLYFDSGCVLFEDFEKSQKIFSIKSEILLLKFVMVNCEKNAASSQQINNSIKNIKRNFILNHSVTAEQFQILQETVQAYIKKILSISEPELNFDSNLQKISEKIEKIKTMELEQRDLEDELETIKDLINKLIIKIFDKNFQLLFQDKGFLTEEKLCNFIKRLPWNSEFLNKINISLLNYRFEKLNKLYKDWNNRKESISKFKISQPEIVNAFTDSLNLTNFLLCNIKFKFILNKKQNPLAKAIEIPLYNPKIPIFQSSKADLVNREIIFRDYEYQTLKINYEYLKQNQLAKDKFTMLSKEKYYHSERGLLEFCLENKELIVEDLRQGLDTITNEQKITLESIELNMHSRFNCCLHCIVLLLSENSIVFISLLSSLAKKLGERFDYSGKNKKMALEKNVIFSRDNYQITDIQNDPHELLKISQKKFCYSEGTLFENSLIVEKKEYDESLKRTIFASENSEANETIDCLTLGHFIKVANDVLLP